MHVFLKNLRYQYRFFSSTLCKCSKTPRHSIAQVLLNKSPTGNVLIKGWVDSIAKTKQAWFIKVCDGSSWGSLQVLLTSNKFRDRNLKVGCSIEVVGDIVESIGHQQDMEMHAKSIKVNAMTGVFPFPGVQGGSRSYSPSYCRQHLHLRHKLDLYRAVLTIRNTLTMAIHNYYQDRDYLHIHTPILTRNDCEGAGEVFQLATPPGKESSEDTKPIGSRLCDAFNYPVYLTVSGQLHLEAMANGLNKVYSFGPVFRADFSPTSRHHLSEFYMVECETAFCEELDELIERIEDVIKSVSREVIGKCDHELHICTKELSKQRAAGLTTSSDSHTSELLANITSTEPFKRLTYTEAVDILQEKEAGEGCGIVWGERLASAHERCLLEHFGCEHPVFITHLPSATSPFYAARVEGGGEDVTASVDLLLPGVGEVVGGTLRAFNPDALEKHLNPEAREMLQWYIDVRRSGGAPSAGYGLGFDRLLQCLTGMGSIRECIPFPRWFNHCQH